MWKKIKPLKVRRFNVETTFDDVELSGECRLVGNTLTVTVTKPFVGMNTQVHIPYYKGSLKMEKAREMALDELELCYLDFIGIAENFETYKEIVFKQRHYLLELERRRRSLMATREIIKREYIEGKIDSYEHYRSYRAVKDALEMIDTDGRDHYEKMIREYDMANIGYQFVKYLVLWILHNEEVARKMIKADKKRHKEIQEWLDSDSNTTWDEWQNLKNGNNNEGG